MLVSLTSLDTSPVAAKKHLDWTAIKFHPMPIKILEISIKMPKLHAFAGFCFWNYLKSLAFLTTFKIHNHYIWILFFWVFLFFFFTKAVNLFGFSSLESKISFWFLEISSWSYTHFSPDISLYSGFLSSPFLLL